MKRDFDVDATAAAANVEQLSKIAEQQQQLFSQAVIQLQQQQQQQ